MKHFITISLTALLSLSVCALNRTDAFSIDGHKGFRAEYFQNMKWEGPSPLVRYEKKVDHKWGNGTAIGNGIVTNYMTAVWRTTFTAPQTQTYCFELLADDDAYLLINGKRPEKVGVINNYYLLDAKEGEEFDIEIRYTQEGDTADILFETGLLTKADCKKTAESVADADVIVFVGGLSAKLEGEENSVRIEGFDRGDRVSIDLPEIQKDMLEALTATGKPVVFILMTGSAIGLEWEDKNIPAIINAWYGGQACGDAVADVLFGDFNPSGKLPVTFYKSVEDLPDFEEYDMTGRTYRYFKGEPVYAFGHGLSYTDFEFGKGRIIKEKDGSEHFVVYVKNTGDREGAEVVQLYVSKTGDTNGPIKALRGFCKINLKPGEKSQVRIPIGDETFTWWNEQSGKMEPLAGEYIIHYGNSSAESNLQKIKYTYIN